MNLRDILYNELKSNRILEEELFEIIKEEKILNRKDGDVAVTDEEVFQYLRNNNYPITSDNCEMTKKHLMNTNVSITQIKETEVNHLDEFTEDDMKDLIDVCILKKLVNLDKKINSRQKIKYEYKIYTVRDKGNGSVDVDALSAIINRMASEGYRVKNVFTNELGKNSVSVAGIGVNSTMDQVVVIFEREIYE